MDPELNAPVTVVLPDRVEHVLFFGSGLGGILVTFKRQHPAEVNVLGPEGVTWIREHHAWDSAPVLACRAAQALLR
jgi:hypothetical protein